MLYGELPGALAHAMLLHERQGLAAAGLSLRQRLRLSRGETAPLGLPRLGIGERPTRRHFQGWVLHDPLPRMDRRRCHPAARCCKISSNRESMTKLGPKGLRSGRSCKRSLGILYGLFAPKTTFFLRPFLGCFFGAHKSAGPVDRGVQYKVTTYLEHIVLMATT